MKRYHKILLAGGTGQVGKALIACFKDTAESIVILSRHAAPLNGNIRTVVWDGINTGSWAAELEGADILINLTGKNVNCRYTDKNKKIILESRVNSVKALARAVAQCRVKPRLWIQSASATRYRNAEDKPMDEATGETGKGFSVEVCKKWEDAFWEQTKPFTSMRKVVLRTSLVLSPGLGLVPRLKNFVRFGLGGKMGSGNQMVSWIHEQDVAGIVEWIALHPQIDGTLNCTSPYPLPNREMMKLARKELGMPFGLPSPRALLAFGAWLVGTETELVLKSRWVVPTRLIESGYTFTYPRFDSAIHNLL